MDKKQTKSRKINTLHLLLTIAAVLLVLILLGLGIYSLSGKDEPEETVTPEPTEETYDAEENVIDVVKYATTILEESEDAGQEYIESTLFLGDSNTARFLKVADSTGHSFTTRQNTIGVVGMGIDAIASLPCMDFYTGRYTMPQAVKILQPERVIITFGTNNLSGTSTDATSFIERYTKQIQAVQNAYPSVDIIVNSIPPVAQRRDYINVSMTQIDAFNKAIVEMCEKNEWKYLNSAEALKDKKTGYGQAEYFVSDGLHLSQKGIEALFKYIRSHSYITDDDRPKPLASIPTVVGVPDGLIKINPLNEKEFTEDDYQETEPEPSQGPDLNTKDGCTVAGKYWYDNSCHDEPKATADPESTKEGCNAAGKYWYKKQCIAQCPDGYEPDGKGGCKVIEGGSTEPTPTPTPTPTPEPTTDPTPVPPTPAEQCANNGGTWDGSTCVYPPTPAEQCANNGGTWDGSTCVYPPSPAEQCANNGGTWDGSTCVYPPSPAEECANNGGTWDGSNCVYPPSPAEECANNGGTWDGSSCVYNTPDPGGNEGGEETPAE
ncbi:MAG: hypothetical protein IKE36_05060 [Solobacterium sp.]|nr:hypothetical protein [Solobacterium sp.]